MPGLSSSFISLADLYLAYRKAKADAFFETTHFHALAFVEYEQRLYTNLNRLLVTLQDSRGAWATDASFVGGHTDVPRSLDNFDNKESIHFHALDPVEDWQRCYEKSAKVPAVARFRMLIVPTVNMQIVSALWIIKVGYRFDMRVDKQHSFGNRLRGLDVFPRIGKDESAFLNKECIGLFVPYFSAYRRWRELGLREMREALKRGQSIIALTMDIRQFYHRASPHFLLRPEFLRAIQIELSEDESHFTSQLLSSIRAWYESTPDYALRRKGALPVGLSASKIIANVLLCDFDKIITSEMKPLYYGRYVDDIFLVFKAPKGVSSGIEVMRMLVRASKGLLRIESRNKRDPSLRLKLSYAKDSDLVFAGGKQKIFYLNSGHGLDLVEQISEQIRRQSSEHRLLEELPDTSAEMASRALLATPDATLEADALRKADTVSVRRLGFSLLLRDVESYSHDLNAKEWKYLRLQFYGLVQRHLLTPRGIFDFVGYIHRVFGLMVACNDMDQAVDFLDRFDQVGKLIERTTTGGTSEKERFGRCRQYYIRAFVQAALQSSTVPGFKFDRAFGNVLRRLRQLDKFAFVPQRMRQVRAISERILNSDWGRRPYKDYWYYSQSENAEGPPVPRARDVRRLLRLAGIRRFRIIADRRVPFWPALVFPTRPLSLPEMVLIAPKLLENDHLLRRTVMALRGARVPTQEMIGKDLEDKRDHPPHIAIPNDVNGRVRVAVTSVETSDSQWAKALRGKSDRSLRRYRTLRKLVNRILEEKPKPSYIAFPECSLPRRWAIRMCNKLAKNGISLLGGVEYYRRRGKVRNDCLVSLTTDWPGYNSYILRLQPKLVPAYEEARALRSIGTSMYQPTIGELSPPVYVHGEVCLGILLCSDLTNIDNRRYFQGQVDALFVLEWNPDLQTFSFLVEATAHDVHAFVVQVNNRKYGDSRVRAPYRIEHQRDSVRVKGGITDYYVIADLDYLSLRAFQKRKTPPRGGAFKPPPIGFRMSSVRRRKRKEF